MTDHAAPFLDARDRLTALTDGLSREDFNRKPSAKSWSAGECIVHLNKTAKLYLPRFEAALGPDAPRGTGPFDHGWIGRRFVEGVRPGSMAIPTLPGMKPPAAGVHASDIDPDRALERFHGDIERYLGVVEAAEGKDLAAIKIRSPFLAVLKLPIGAFIEAMGLHSLRHVMQAERAVAAAGAA